MHGLAHAGVGLGTFLGEELVAALGTALGLGGVCGACRYPTAVVVGVGSVMFGGWSDGMGGIMGVFIIR